MFEQKNRKSSYQFQKVKIGVAENRISIKANQPKKNVTTLVESILILKLQHFHKFTKNNPGILVHTIALDTPCSNTLWSLLFKQD